MRGKLMTGAVIGAAIGMMIVPQLDRSTKKKIVKSSKMVARAASDIYDTMSRIGK